MMVVLAAALAVCAVAIGALAFALAQLRGQVRTLSHQVVDRAAQVDQAAAPRDASPAPRVEQSHPNPATSTVDVESAPAGEPVAVITNLTTEPADDIDLSVSRVASITLAGPLIKVAAFSHGLQRAMSEDSRMRIGYAVRKELKRQRKVRRRQRARQAPSKGWGQ